MFMKVKYNKFNKNVNFNEAIFDFFFKLFTERISYWHLGLDMVLYLYLQKESILNLDLFVLKFLKYVKSIIQITYSDY